MLNDKDSHTQLKPYFSSKEEGDIYILLVSVVELIELISDNFLGKARIYLIEHLILSLRELSFYFRKYFQEKIDDDMQKNMDIIKDIRDSICHRSSERNWAQKNMKIQGCFVYNAGDIRIQYGKNTIHLIGGLIKLFSDFKKIFNDPSSPYRVCCHPSMLEKENSQLEANINKIKHVIKEELAKLTGRSS